jgi:Fuc2NAc and GlcNAc transferase
MIASFWETVLGFVVSAAGTGVALFYARRVGMVDVPNHRSSHDIPIPRGGGIALVGSVIGVGTSAFLLLGHRPEPIHAFLLLTVLALAVVGWLDDQQPVAMRLRLAIHLMCGISVALLVNQIAPMEGALNIAWLVWWTFWTVASINIVNFMDGIDGMVAFQGIVYGVFLFGLLGSPDLAAQFGLIVAAACLGFMLWNWAPAKMFMGDVGSGPLGLFFVIGGALALKGAPAEVVFLPLFPLYWDAFLTMILRFRRGERLSDAHRSHLYQRLARTRYGHGVVTSAYALAAAIGAIVGLLVRDASALHRSVAIFAYVLAVAILWKLGDSRSTE